MKSLEFSVYKIISATNRQFYFFLSDVNVFYFSCLITLGRISNTLLNRNGKKWDSMPVPDLRGKDFNFSPLSTMLTVALLYMALIMLSNVPSILDFLLTQLIVFCHERMFSFAKYFFCISWDDHMILTFDRLMGCSTCTDLCMLSYLEINHAW